MVGGPSNGSAGSCKEGRSLLATDRLGAASIAVVLEIEITQSSLTSDLLLSLSTTLLTSPWPVLGPCCLC